jgi:hypothetical protein
LASITILPSVENAGRFRVWMNNLNLPHEEGEDGKSKMKVPEGVVVKKDGWVLVSDRKIEGGFPEVSKTLFFAQILFHVLACVNMCVLINDTSYAMLHIVEDAQTTDTFARPAFERSGTFGREGTHSCSVRRLDSGISSRLWEDVCAN